MGEEAITHWVQRPLHTNTVGLVSYFFQDHVARRLQGFHVTPQTNESQWKFSVSPPV